MKKIIKSSLSDLIFFSLSSGKKNTTLGAKRGEKGMCFWLGEEGKKKGKTKTAEFIITKRTNTESNSSHEPSAQVS